MGEVEINAFLTEGMLFLDGRPPGPRGRGDRAG